MKTKMTFLIFLIALLCNVQKLFSQAGVDWQLVGNNVLANQFLGSTNNATVNFRTNNIQRMTIGTTGIVGINTTLANPNITMLDVRGDINLQAGTTVQNTGYRINGQVVLQVKTLGCLFVGPNAGTNNVLGALNGINNTFVGNSAGNLNSTGRGNTFIGNSAGLVNNTGNDNTFVGTQSGLSNTTGEQNTFVGEFSGSVNTTGSWNTYTGNHTAPRGGSNAGLGTGNFNTFSGWNAGHDIQSASNNTIMGATAGFSITTGSENVISGRDAAHDITIGSDNVYSGFEAGFENREGKFNVFIGYRAGWNQSGSTCTFIGNQAGFDPANSYNLQNAAAFGNGAFVTANNKMILGNNNVNVGIGLSNDKIYGGPQNKLEINESIVGTATTSNGVGTGTGKSGLRFRDLTSASTPIPNVGSMGVLSVNASGDVVYVPGGGGIGNLCTGTPNPLTGNYEVPLATNNFVFSGKGKVGIGTSCTSPTAKLEVQNINEYDNGGKFNTNNSSSYNAGVVGTASNASYQSDGVAGSGGQVGAGGWSVGVAGYTYCPPSGPTTTTYVGVYGGACYDSPYIYAGYFDGQIRVNGYTKLYGNTDINGGLTTNGGNVTINGALNVYGQPWSTNLWQTSDRMFKSNIDSITNANSILKRIKPKQYYFDTVQYAGFNFSNKKQYGLIAQDVEQVLPELVSSNTKPATHDSLGNIIEPSITYKGLNYNAFITLLIKGMQEQQATIDSLRVNQANSSSHRQDSINASLQEQINQLASMLNNCCNANHGNSNHSVQNQSNNNVTDVTLKDGQAIVLEQNVPNPFAEQTTINYTLPDNTGKAQMLFYNAGGKLIQSVELTPAGKGSLNVFASDLSNGLYTYTLVVDGKIIETKKMLKQ